MVMVFVRDMPSQALPADSKPDLVLDAFAEPNRATLALALSRLQTDVGGFTPVAWDLLLFSAAVYTADKKILRRVSADRWTREIRISCPVNHPDRWKAASPALEEGLSFLTGDRWFLDWRNASRPSQAAFTEKADAACLFSGGLDSLAGAINLLEEGNDAKVLLVGHYDSTLTLPLQEHLSREIIAHYGAQHVTFASSMVRPAERRLHQVQPLPSLRETTTRSRSLLFIGLGLAAAHSAGSQVPLFVPENGFIALNAPLVPERSGSCSTRTTHPYYLACMREGLAHVGFENLITNPLILYTKGEVLQSCKNAALLRRLARLTVSCSHPEQGRFEHQPYGNCGYCFPCIIRRASLYTIGLDFAGDYRHDVCSEEQLITGRTMRSRDIRAVLAALAREDESQLLPLMAGPLPPEVPLSAATRVYRQSLAEVRNWFLGNASPAVRREAGL